MSDCVSIEDEFVSELVLELGMLSGAHNSTRRHDPAKLHYCLCGAWQCLGIVCDCVWKGKGERGGAMKKDADR